MSGAVNQTANERSAGVTTIPDGTPGTVDGVTVTVLDGTPPPAALTARTRTRYERPFTNPAIDPDRDDPDDSANSTHAPLSTEYSNPVTGASPGRDGGVQDTATTPSPGSHPIPDGADGGTVILAKDAVTDLASTIDTVHEPVPEHPPPDQPLNKAPAGALAVRMTDVSCPKSCTQSAPQVIPTGLETTIPAAAPVPVFDTVNGYVFNVNVADTDMASVIDNVHSPVPLQAPDQPANIDPAAAVADNTTTEP